MSESLIPTHDELGTSLGAIELGVLISTVLYGNLIVQMYAYFHQTVKDRSWLRMAVVWCFFVETFHTALFWCYVYYLSVTHYGHPEKLTHLCWHICSAIVPQAVTAATVQAITSYRIYSLSGKLWLALPGWIFQIIRLGLSIFLTKVALQSELLPVFVKEYNWVVVLTMSNSAAIDLMNSLLLSYFLYARRTGYQRSTAIINKLIIFSIETGLATSTIAILLLVFVIIQPYSGIWLALFVIYSKVYANSLLVLLNARNHLREITSPHELSNHRRNVLSIGVSSDDTVRPLDITVDIETMRHEDGDSLGPMHSGVPLKPLSAHYREGIEPLSPNRRNSMPRSMRSFLHFPRPSDTSTLVSMESCVGSAKE